MIIIFVGGCGFNFHADKLHKSGKCPQTWISPPLIHIEAPEAP